MKTSVGPERLWGSDSIGTMDPGMRKGGSSCFSCIDVILGYGGCSSSTDCDSDVG